MNEKLYYWAENLEGYSSHNVLDYDQIIEIKRLNFFIGKNNAGKSRFLRKIFSIKSNFYSDNINLMDLSEFHEILLFINNENNNQLKRKIYTGEVYNYNRKYMLDSTPIPDDELSKLSEIANFLKKNNYLETKNFKVHLEKINYLKDYEIDEKYTFNNLINKLTQNFSKFRSSTNFSELRKKYIPTLRGLRPVIGKNHSSEFSYLLRTYTDYFYKEIELEKDKELAEKRLKNKIITGESFYQTLFESLLGEYEQRQKIRDFETKLSEYFFNNEAITLIPKLKDDVIHIKIGNEPQFPISQLGDGLQQVIILTYEAFIKKDETHAFFIEEPELHMHAGMVRQLMNFYLNETNHYYFFTTHSNHLLDMADESDQVLIQKFVKEQNKDDSTKFDFKIYRCDRDRDLLASLGVKPSSVYLANCTIWVEGITDRLYITKYMEKYLKELKTLNPDLYKQYLRFMPNYHYTFIEYAGSNLVHWSFSDEYADHLDDKGLSAKAIASEMLLIADGDIQTKPERVKALEKELNKENYFILKCKETENTLPKNTIIRVAEVKFAKMHRTTTQSYNISLLTNITDDTYFDHDEFGIGKLLDQAIKKPKSTTTKTAFADGQGVGTIKHKLDFCREIIKDFDENSDWKLTPKATELCERIFQHIEKCNKQ